MLSVVLADLIKGIISWTLLEYILHKHLFHMNVGTNPKWATFHFLLHGVHHKVCQHWTPEENYLFAFPRTLALSYLKKLIVYYLITFATCWNCYLIWLFYECIINDFFIRQCFQWNNSGSVWSATFGFSSSSGGSVCSCTLSNIIIDKLFVQRFVMQR